MGKQVGREEGNASGIPRKGRHVEAMMMGRRQLYQERESRYGSS